MCQAVIRQCEGYTQHKLGGWIIMSQFVTFFAPDPESVSSKEKVLKNFVNIATRLPCLTINMSAKRGDGRG